VSRSRQLEPEDQPSQALLPARTSDREIESDTQHTGRGSSEYSQQTDAPSLNTREPRDRPRLRTLHHDRDRAFQLRDSEVAALIEIAKFRSVRTDDLTEIHYKGDRERATQDVRNLTAQGLIRRRTLDGTEKDQLLAVTRAARQFLERAKPQSLDTQQTLYHGFVKPREARHDAALYRLFHKAADRITSQGGTKLRVVLDFELKRKIYRELAKLKSLPPEAQANAKTQIAEAYGLKVVNGKIPLPDLRIEYETREHEQARVGLELATKDYRGHHVADKAKAGFSIYALADEAPRLRAGLQDPQLITEILSL
jgi:DNA-binding MarR family transcriptional regulator